MLVFLYLWYSGPFDDCILDMWIEDRPTWDHLDWLKEPKFARWWSRVDCSLLQPIKMFNKTATDYHRILLNAQKWMGWVGIGSLNAPLLWAPFCGANKWILDSIQDTGIKIKCIIVHEAGSEQEPDIRVTLDSICTTCISVFMDPDFDKWIKQVWHELGSHTT